MKRSTLFSNHPWVRVCLALLLAGGLLAQGTRPAQALAWENRNTTNGLGSDTVYSVFASGSKVYAGTEGGLSISSNGGTSFTNKTFTSDINDPNGVNGVFASGNNVFAATWRGLYISFNGGSSFGIRTTADGLGSDWVWGVYADGNTAYAATAGGLSISGIGYNGYSNKTTADGLGSNSVRGVFVVSSLLSATVYAATEGGLSISTNGGSSFNNKTKAANGLGSNLVYGVYVSDGVIYAATDDGLSISTNDGSSFSNKTTANGLGSNQVWGVYASGSNVYAATENGLSVSTDGGNTFTNDVTENGLGNNVVYGVYGSGGTLYAATVQGLSVQVPNLAPEANAGPDLTRSIGQPVTLDGSGSTDDHGDTLRYQWVQVGGPAVTMSSLTDSRPTFTAPSIPAVMTFQLTVTDRYAAKDPTPDEVVVTITWNQLYLPILRR